MVGHALQRNVGKAADASLWRKKPYPSRRNSAMSRIGRIFHLYAGNAHRMKRRKVKTVAVGLKRDAWDLSSFITEMQYL
jgi:hypothetical protein